MVSRTLSYSLAACAAAAFALTPQPGANSELNARNAQLRFYNGGTMTTPLDSLALLAQKPGGKSKAAQLYVSSYRDGQILRVGRDRAGFAAPLTAEYFDQRDFKGKRIRRSENQINHDWGNGAPLTKKEGFGQDSFSVRWTGRLRTGAAGEYRFTTTSDDGVRLWVNGKKIIDRWHDQAPTDHSGTIELAAGATVSLRMDYYENGGGAVARLRWQPPGVAQASIVQLSGGFAARESRQAGLSARALAAGDWNGDGISDLAAANFHFGGSVQLLLGDGGETITGSTQLSINSVGDDPIAIALADLNGDRQAELLVLNQSSRDLRIFQRSQAPGRANAGQAKLIARYVLPDAGSAQARPRALRLADLNGDGRSDCAVLLADRVLIFLNASTSDTPAFAKAALSAGLPAAFLRTAPEGASDLALGDFDRDGDPDLAVAAFAPKQRSVHVQLLVRGGDRKSTPKYAPVEGLLAFTPKPGTAPTDGTTLAETGPTLRAVDLDGNGSLDLIATHPTHARLAFFSNVSRRKGRLSRGMFRTAALPELPAAASTLRAADFNGDGALDLAVLHSTRNLLSVFFAGKR